MASALKELMPGRLHCPHCVECVSGFPAPFDKIRLIQHGLQGPACLIQLPSGLSPSPSLGSSEDTQWHLQVGHCLWTMREGMDKGHKGLCVHEAVEGPMTRALCQCASERELRARWRRASPAFGFYV